MTALTSLWSGPIYAADSIGHGLVVLDDFNRANENPLTDGGKWLSRNANFNLQLLSNRCAGLGSVLNSMYWAAATFGPNCGAFVTIPVLGGSSDYVRLYLRLASPGTLSESGYMAQWINSGTSGLIIFKETTREAFTTLAQNTALTYAAGDVITFTAVSNVLTVLKNGASVLTVNDSSFIRTGNLALGMRATTIRGDDFGGGTL